MVSFLTRNLQSNVCMFKHPLVGLEDIFITIIPSLMEGDERLNPLEAFEIASGIWGHQSEYYYDQAIPTDRVYKFVNALAVIIRSTQNKNSCYLVHSFMEYLCHYQQKYGNLPAQPLIPFLRATSEIFFSTTVVRFSFEKSELVGKMLQFCLNETRRELKISTRISEPRKWVISKGIDTRKTLLDLENFLESSILLLVIRDEFKNSREVLRCMLSPPEPSAALILSKGASKETKEQVATTSSQPKPSAPSILDHFEDSVFSAASQTPTAQIVSQVAESQPIPSTPQFSEYSVVKAAATELTYQPKPSAPLISEITTSSPLFQGTVCPGTLFASANKNSVNATAEDKKVASKPLCAYPHLKEDDLRKISIEELISGLENLGISESELSKELEKQYPGLNFVCPLTTSLLKEPMLADDNFNYEKVDLENYIKFCNDNHIPLVSPMTKQPMANSTMLNGQLQRIIRGFLCSKILLKQTELEEKASSIQSSHK